MTVQDPILRPSGRRAVLIDGKAAAEGLDQAARAGALELTQTLGRPPCLAVVLAGEDPASQVYVRNKVRRTESAGMISVEHRLPASVSQDELLALIGRLNIDPVVDGILVQLPLPAGLDAQTVVQAIDPAKDVDGLTAASAGALVLGAPGLRPCTPAGCVYLARQALGDLTGRHVVVIGRSILVGKPAALLFLDADCTVSLAHSRTRDLPALARQADILIAAAGRPGMVKADWIRPGATVIDVGINRVARPDGSSALTGDADYEAALDIADFITPVPGGVGPMTIAMLLINTVRACARRAGLAIPASVAGTGAG
ncbi:bifunctional methylenetetrahydrofolate dehydrogenase/methenyltetrahydrofolate cyclohydrolase FolD [Alkalicaulis satelles]|uniref:Bifunctional protein FolD n=1 Tax=Alkalicaulis satelles TaxID=2609175 RepID=A0A5M6ZJM1_9PROT|nr:bifunctional methylenetetrahydrofolate dehydrogenase/methenyltetrahydrofolate cyclohydrolase FolD [Alkalicaulis satelles]KAA5803448.1 bifunctional methylenetetrahydrofolate dehydrogenase/methenyltetrahydrofolate cyclohydrolase FolD [Alkalicaulis satelles]